MIVRGLLLVSAFLLLAGFSPGSAAARPDCYDTGPGHETCVSDGDYGNPIYQGPKLPDGYVPWAPDASPRYAPPAYVPPAAASIDPSVLALRLQQEIQRSVDDPAGGVAAYEITVGDVTISPVGNTDNGLAYAGTARMWTGDGPEVDIPVRAITNGGDFVWKIEPGALAPLVG